MDQLTDFLQFHLATDASTVEHVHVVLQSLTSSLFQESKNVTAWVVRLASLMHSKDAGARWAGLCLVLQTAKLSRQILLESAQGWVSTITPILAKNDPTPVLKAAVRVLLCIYTSNHENSEYHRQIVVPNVTKFSLALLSIIEKNPDQELKILVIATLTKLVYTFPSLHRALVQQIITMTSKTLEGSAFTSTSDNMAHAAAGLRAALFVTGGKTGSSSIWRGHLDEAIEACTRTVNTLRDPMSMSRTEPGTSDPLSRIPLYMDRLKCSVTTLCSFLTVATTRPLPIPVGHLARLCEQLIGCSSSNEFTEGIDPAVRATQASVLSCLLVHGCALTTALVECVQSHFTPHANEVLRLIAQRLEQTQLHRERLLIIRTASTITSGSHWPLDTHLLGRITKIIISQLAVFLSPDSAPSNVNGAPDTEMSRKKGKKRARELQGDELLKSRSGSICSTPEQGELALACLDAVASLLRPYGLQEHLHSLTSRVVLSLLIVLPQMPAICVSEDLTLRDQMLRRVRDICVNNCTEVNHVLRRALPLIIGSSNFESHTAPELFLQEASAQNLLNVLMQPRLPPPVEPLPEVRHVVLSYSEEGVEERAVRQRLGLVAIPDDSSAPSQAAPLPAYTTTPNAQPMQPPAQLPAPTAQLQPDTNIPPGPVVEPELPIAGVSKPTTPLAEPSVSTNPSTKDSTRLQGFAFEQTPKPSSPPQQLPDWATASHNTQTGQGTDETNIALREKSTTAIILDDDEDEDMEIPKINMESDTDSES